MRVSPSGSDAETVVTPTSFSTMRRSATDSITGVRFVRRGRRFSASAASASTTRNDRAIRVASGIARIFCFKAATFINEIRQRR